MDILICTGKNKNPGLNSGLCEETKLIFRKFFCEYLYMNEF